MLFDLSLIHNTDDLKKVWKQLCFKYHPDKGGSKDKFLLLQKEYEHLLKNPSLYDKPKEKTVVRQKEDPATLKYFRQFNDVDGRVDIILPKIAFDEGCIVYMMNKVGSEIRLVMPKSNAGHMTAKVQLGGKQLEIFATAEKERGPLV